MTYYIRDAEVNILETYTHDIDHQQDQTYTERLTLTERVWYGSSRIGADIEVDDVVREREFTVHPSDVPHHGDPAGRTYDTPTITTVPPYYTLLRGRKAFELNDHLGNVLATVSDKRLAIDGKYSWVEGEAGTGDYSWDNGAFTETTGTGNYDQIQAPDDEIDFYMPRTVQANRYYPFGMVLPEDGNSSGGYRFGFGGHERIDEATGNANTIDMGDRWLNVRLGRTPKPDAKGFLYPSVSPYSFANNNPVLFIDPDGKVIVVPTADGQAQTLAILSKAFGKRSIGFGFNECNELTFNGNPSEFQGKELEVFEGLHNVMKAPEVTRILFEANKETNNRGGEATKTIYDHPKEIENTIWIDPIEDFPVMSTNLVTLYKGKNGEPTSDLGNAKLDSDGNPIPTGGHKEELIVTDYDSKAARFFHGIGHVLFPKKSEQESVINYDNAARSIFKRERKNGTFKSDPETPREVDSSHENQIDD
jgi:RHS repeat-associated protein